MNITGICLSDRVETLCECGPIAGKVNLTAYGMKINFSCYDCKTFFALDVTQNH